MTNQTYTYEQSLLVCNDPNFNALLHFEGVLDEFTKKQVIDHIAAETGVPAELIPAIVTDERIARYGE